MKDHILILLSIWAISAVIMRKQLLEEDKPFWIILLKLVLAPLMLGIKIIEWIWFSIQSALREIKH
jgi:hypothetical protein